MNRERKSREQHFEDAFLPEIERLASTEIDDEFLSFVQKHIDSGHTGPEGVYFLLDAEAQAFENMIRDTDKKIVKKLDIPFYYTYASASVMTAQRLARGEKFDTNPAKNKVTDSIRFRGKNIRGLAQNDFGQFKERLIRLINADPSGVSVADYTAYDARLRQMRALQYGGKINNSLVQIGAERYKKYVSTLGGVGTIST